LDFALPTTTQGAPLPGPLPCPYQRAWFRPDLMTGMEWIGAALIITGVGWFTLMERK
jgi:hypothetical protein